MKLYYVYILECKDKYLYTGVTNNISRRLVEHNKGLNESCFTYKRRPVELIFHQEFNDIEQAIYFEKKIKKWSRKKKLALANNNFDLLQLLAECKNTTHSENRDFDSVRTDINLDDFIFDTQKKSKIEPVLLEELEAKKISLFIKREDQLHPTISGNKYRKLAFNIEEAKKQQKQQLLTFGGAYSNHILATAGAGYEFGFKTVGIIRGDELGNDLEKTLNNNATLRAAKEFGMQFKFISRSEYRLKNTDSFLKELELEFPNSYVLPEGGTNDLAVKGCEFIIEEKENDYDYICVAVGTGGTISGIINSSKENQRVLGFPALKGNFLEEEINKNNVNKSNWKLIQDYHFGGYAKINSELVTFINTFKEKTIISLDPVYTGKMVFGVLDLIQKDFFPENSKILMIHTGGLQGISGMNILLKKKGLPLLK